MGAFVGVLGLGLVGASALVATVEAQGPPNQSAGNNRCDEKHPDRGRDQQGHNNPKCATATPTPKKDTPTATPTPKKDPPTATPTPKKDYKDYW